MFVVKPEQIISYKWQTCKGKCLSTLSDCSGVLIICQMLT